MQRCSGETQRETLLLQALHHPHFSLASAVTPSSVETGMCEGCRMEAPTH